MLVALIAYAIQGIIFGVICSYVASTKGYDGGFACNKPLREDAPAPAEAAKANAQKTLQDSIPNLIEQLGRLHVQGILTDEEFQQKKADLLAELHPNC